jgi:hypothetical protein
MIVYRTGRHNARTIYLQAGPEPDRAADMQVGTMDTPELGARVVEALNRLEEFEAAERHPVDLGGDLSKVPPPGALSSIRVPVPRPERPIDCPSWCES